MTTFTSIEIVLIHLSQKFDQFVQMYSVLILVDHDIYPSEPLTFRFVCGCLTTEPQAAALYLRRYNIDVRLT